MVARLNGVQEAAGSNPVTRTTKSPEIVRFQDFFFIFAPKSVLYINFIPERVPELYQNRVWKRWTQWDALLRPYKLREALDCGGFDAALDVEIVLCHVYLRMTGKGQPNALAMRLNVRAAKLKNDYGIHYENTQTHAGRIILLTKISPGA